MSVESVKETHFFDVKCRLFKIHSAYFRFVNKRKFLVRIDWPENAVIDQTSKIIPGMILAAGTRKSKERAQYTFEVHFPYLFVESLASAKAAITPEIALIMCSLDFCDHSGLFDLLRYAKENQATCHIPFLCLQANEDSFTPIILQSIEIATKAMGAVELVMLYEWRSSLGDEVAIQKLREHLRRYITC